MQQMWRAVELQQMWLAVQLRAIQLQHMSRAYHDVLQKASLPTSNGLAAGTDRRRWSSERRSLQRRTRQALKLPSKPRSVKPLWRRRQVREQHVFLGRRARPRQQQFFIRRSWSPLSIARLAVEMPSFRRVVFFRSGRAHGGASIAGPKSPSSTGASESGRRSRSRP